MTRLQATVLFAKYLSGWIDEKPGTSLIKFYNPVPQRDFLFLKYNANGFSLYY